MVLACLLLHTPRKGDKIDPYLEGLLRERPAANRPLSAHACVRSRLQSIAHRFSNSRLPHPNTSTPLPLDDEDELLLCLVKEIP